MARSVKSVYHDLTIAHHIHLIHRYTFSCAVYRIGLSSSSRLILDQSLRTVCSKEVLEDFDNFDSDWSVHSVHGAGLSDDKATSRISARLHQIRLDRACGYYVIGCVDCIKVSNLNLYILSETVGWALETTFSA